MVKRNHRGPISAAGGLLGSITASITGRGAGTGRGVRWNDPCTSEVFRSRAKSVSKSPRGRVSDLCGEASPTGAVACILKLGHSGPHGWDRPRPKSESKSSIGACARALQNALYRHEVAKHLEPDFVFRLDKLAETP